MLALSLWEPHATAIAEGIKPWETRGWDLLPRYIGVPGWRAGSMAAARRHLERAF